MPDCLPLIYFLERVINKSNFENRVGYPCRKLFSSSLAFPLQTTSQCIYRSTQIKILLIHAFSQSQGLAGRLQAEKIYLSACLYLLLLLHKFISASFYLLLVLILLHLTGLLLFFQFLIQSLFGCCRQ